MKKKHLYLAAIIAILLVIVGVIASTLIPRVFAARTAEKLVGTWFFDSYQGNGGKWVTFFDNGSFTLHQEITAADGELLYQDSSSFGTAAYEVLSGSRMRMTITSMGSSHQEDVDFQLVDDRTLIIDGDTYIKQD